MDNFTDAGSMDTAPDTASVSDAGSADGGVPSIDESLSAIFDKRTEADTAAPEGATDPAGADTEVSSAQPQQEAQEPLNAAIVAPNAWSADMKGKWADVPPDVQQYINQREADAHAQITRLGEEVAEGRPVRELLDQNMDLFDASGVSVTDGLPMLFEAQRLLDKDPMQGIAAIAQNYGIDLPRAFGPQAEGGNPEVAGLQSQVAQLQNQLQQHENRQKMANSREDTARMSEAQQILQEFGKDKPHFEREDVRNMMGTLISNGQAVDLASAYDAACHAIPEVREELAKQAEAEREAEAKKQREAAVKDAKRVAKSYLGSKTTGVSSKGTSPNDDAYLGAVFDQAVAGRA